MLKVKLFGFARASYAGFPLPGFPNQQAGLLLCFLMLNKLHPHNRERLAAVFWADQPPYVARKNFRNTLWKLRQMLFVAGAQPEDYLDISDESVSFINFAPYQLDVDTLESAASFLNTPDESLNLNQVNQLETAVDQYDGDLLENVYEDWCLYDRERLRLVYLSMLNKLMGYHISQSSYERGLTYGQKMLVLEPTREDTHRQIMWLHWQMGDRAAALTQYKVCIQVLKDELGVAPLDTTRQLYEQILHVSPHELPLPSARLDFQPSAQNALEHLHHLQQVLERTNAELAQLERMILQALGNSQQ